MASRAKPQHLPLQTLRANAIQTSVYITEPVARFDILEVIDVRGGRMQCARAGVNPTGPLFIAAHQGLKEGALLQVMDWANVPFGDDKAREFPVVAGARAGSRLYLTGEGKVSVEGERQVGVVLPSRVVFLGPSRAWPAPVVTAPAKPPTKKKG